jgi:hypothetical protein
MRLNLKKPLQLSETACLVLLSAWRAGIVSVTITFTNLAVASMNEQFAVLILCNLSSNTDGFGLSVSPRGYARTTFRPNRP